ncbi:hypothetical protein FHS95_002804 [Sphingomonas naasensis]|nr:hypothetical protein [Sphingomonas naasensis]
MRSLAPAPPRPRLARMLEAPNAGISTAPAEIDGQEVFVHKRANLFPRGKGARA